MCIRDRSTWGYIKNISLEMKAQQQDIYQNVKELFAGCLGGVAQVLTGQPFDILKVRLQSQSLENPVYKGTIDCFKQTLANEGPGAFYKGTLPPLMGVGACVAIQFSVLEETKRFFRKLINIKEDEVLPLIYVTLSGSAAGFANTIISAPAEHIRIRMQLQSKGNILYKDSLDCARKLFQSNGIRGIYKGTVATVYREIWGYGIYFWAYEMMKRQLSAIQKKEDLSLNAKFWCGGIAGVVFWTGCFPFDVIKTVIQVDDFNKPKYKSFVNCFQTLYAQRGFLGFYRGYIPCLLRAVPVNGVSFLVYESVLSQLGRNGANY
eukprot:TRINITY_DN8548_c0_g1_i6.p1 TRINITY_DN8548_c0_g1~~TRINITY_DN8548_c0_g1_i6.p1  ORF type:complete len:320 (+),score=55.14 TRINITY_DN8548_c0_g1_i6:64-1023(+)